MADCGKSRMPLLVRKYTADEDDITGQDGTISTPKNETFKTIVDRFNTLDEVSKAMKTVGVDQCEIIFGIDYSENNARKGKRTFGGNNLHAEGKLNPYHEVICILGETVEHIDDDGQIPVYGFGADIEDGSQLFPLKKDGECDGFHEVDEVYRAKAPIIKPGKSANFAPVIDEAVKIVQAKKKYHILVIATTGQLSEDDKAASIKSIVEASNSPLSIVVIGVGDGPWDVMVTFDDELPERTFDNFQFVDYDKVKSGANRNPQAAVALAALMEIPDQYQYIKEMNLIEKMG